MCWPGPGGPPRKGTWMGVGSAERGGVEIERDVMGTLEVRGPNVFAGYWREEEKTRGEFTADGWFKTRDVGRIDRHGYVHIVGRAKDLVISGGYKVSPQEAGIQLGALEGDLDEPVLGVPHPAF